MLNIGTETFSHFRADMEIREDSDTGAAVDGIFELLKREAMIPDYCI